MIEFCCCNMRTKSFYLLLIFTSVVFMGIPVASEIRNVNIYKQNAYVVTCVVFLDLLILSFYILSLVAFFHFVVKDSIANKFSHFYVNAIMITSIAMAVFQVMFIIGYLSVSVGKQNHINMTIRAGLELILLTLVFFWARELRCNLPPIKQGEIETEIVVVEKAESVQAEPEIEVKVIEKPRKTGLRKSTLRTSQNALDAQASGVEKGPEVIVRPSVRKSERGAPQQIKQKEANNGAEIVVEDQGEVEEQPIEGSQAEQQPIERSQAE